MTGKQVCQYPVNSDIIEIGDGRLQSGWFNLQIVGNNKRFSTKIKI